MGLVHIVRSVRNWWKLGRLVRPRLDRRGARLLIEPLESRQMLTAVPQFVFDINTVAGTDNGSSPTNAVQVGNTIYFTATDDQNGEELWKTDGTSAGTVLVRDIKAGTGSSVVRELTNVNGTLYFRAADFSANYELWKSDGTSSGTVMVKEIRSTTIQSFPSNLRNINGTLYFAANDGSAGSELWKSDGTESGTVLVADLFPGFNGSSPTDFTEVNGIVYFRANNSNASPFDIELWRTDGTSSGTYLVRDINPGNAISNPNNLINVNGTLFFAANDGTNGEELWKSDGTSSGTVMVSDILSGVSNSSPQYLRNMNGLLVFRATDGTGADLWKSDGTSSGTTMLYDVNPSGSSAPAFFVNVNGVIYFRANDGTNGYELWKTDGTSSGTALVSDLVTLANTGSYPAQLANINGTLYFSAQNPVDRELWKTDGTSSGTVLVKDINPAGSSGPNGFVNLNGKAIFAASDGSLGNEIYVSDGTSSGTTLIKNLRTAQSASSPLGYVEVNGFTYFQASDGVNGAELWKTNGTSTGTSLVKDIRPGSTGSSPQNLVNVNGLLFFTANDGSNGLEVWVSDGTSSGTTLLNDILAGSTGSSPNNLVNVNGALFFGAQNGANGQELWKSDGTSSGTVMVSDIRSGALGSGPRYLVNVNGTLFLRASNGPTGYEVWKSDGTSSGTVLLADVNSTFYQGSSPVNLTNVNGTLFFRANDGLNNEYLYKSDGTSSGTVSVGVFGSSQGPRLLTAVNNTLYFQASDNTNGYELWKSDGTSSGTAIVSNIASGTSNAYVTNLVNVNGTLFFRATNDAGIRDYELWKTDGTSSGTVQVRDIIPGPRSSQLQRLTNVNGQLYFAANQGRGMELWTSDGTSAGTVQVGDIGAGAGSSNPTSLAGSGNTLFFAADAGTGLELFALNTTQPIVSLSVTGSPFAENAGTSTVVATLSEAYFQAVTVTLSLGGTATTNTDYSASGLTITIPVGQTSGSITLTGIDDITFEGSETVIVDVTNVVNGTENGTQSITASITDDETQPTVTLSLSGSPLAENGGVATVRATLSNPSTQDVTVNLGFTGTATSNTDYSASTNTIVILAGQTSGSITLTGTDDITYEGTETAIVDVTSVVNGTENGTQSITASITDDETQPTVTLSLSGSPLAENGGVATVRATLSNPSTQQVTINLGFTGTATNNADYSASTNTIVILAGQTSGSISLASIDDTIFEGTESIVFNVASHINGSTNSIQSVTASITDNDSAPSVSLVLAGSPLAENGGVAVVSATLSNPSSQNVTVNLGFTGTATNNTDYSASSAAIVILAGQTSGSITLTGINDSVSESAESIIVDITSVSNGNENGAQQVTAYIGSSITAATASNVPGLTADPSRYSVNAQTLTIRGTSGIDDIRLIRVNGSQFYTFFNNEVFVFSTATINQVIVLADSGKDVLTFIGSPSVTETATLNPSSFAYNVSGLAIQADAEVQYIFGQSGDSAVLGDSATDDVVYMRHEYSYLFDRATTYVSQPIGFGNVTINANGGGTDQIIMLGDSGDQTFNMTPTQTSLINSGVTMIANSFEYQVALGQGGNDTANLLGSAGNDVYTRAASPATRTPGNPATSILVIGNTFEQVFDISTINVQSGGGADIAILNDSAGNDTLVGSPAETTLQTPYSLDRVTGFRGVYAFGSSGNDTATLDGSSGDDLFQGTANSSVLYRSGAYTLQADAFDLVHANLTGAGNDSATLIDSAGNDTLTAQSNFAQLQYANGNRVRVTAFDTVFARGSNGGVNTRNVTNPLTYSLIFSGTWV